MAEHDIERKPTRGNGRVTITPELATAASLLAHDVPNFVREGIHLAKLEAKSTAKDVGVRAGILSASGYMAAVGFFLVCVGLAFLISEALQRSWAGPLIVGAALVVLAGVAVPIALKAGGKKKPQTAH